mmetsp:Transcript_23585/g.39302  ORF Transcript_23585/g.39302 Transcript_23585/m.39302 type:complete len:296 (+) Transcript_23585:2651-3538(+)
MHAAAQIPWIKQPVTLGMRNAPLHHLCGTNSETSVNIVAMSGHVRRRRVSGKKPDQSGYFLGRSKSLHGDCHQQCVFVWQFCSHIRLNESRANCIHGHSSAAEFLCKRPGHPDDSTLGGCIVGLARITDLTDDGSDIDNTPSLLAHHRSHKGCLGAVEDAIEVNVNHLGEVIWFHHHRQHIIGDPRVVHKNIHWSNFFNCLGKHCLDFTNISTVSFHGNRSTTLFLSNGLDFVNNLQRFGLIGCIIDNDFASCATQGQCNRSTNATTSASYHSDRVWGHLLLFSRHHRHLSTHGG